MKKKTIDNTSIKKRIDLFLQCRYIFLVQKDHTYYLCDRCTTNRVVFIFNSKIFLF